MLQISNSNKIIYNQKYFSLQFLVNNNNVYYLNNQIIDFFMQFTKLNYNKKQYGLEENYIYTGKCSFYISDQINIKLHNLENKQELFIDPIEYFITNKNIVISFEKIYKREIPQILKNNRLIYKYNVYKMNFNNFDKFTIQFELIKKLYDGIYIIKYHRTALTKFIEENIGEIHTIIRTTENIEKNKFYETQVKFYKIKCIENKKSYVKMLIA